MNSAPISPGISAVSSPLFSDNDPKSAGRGQSATASGIDFAELLNNQQDAGKLMQRLEKLLPPQDFERLKLALEDGKSLPQAVTIAVGRLSDAGHWEPESPSPVALPVQQSPFDAGEPQLLGNNPFAGSPDTIPVDAISGPLVQLPPYNMGKLQPLDNNPFAGSPDTIPVHANPGPFVQQPPSNIGEPQPLGNNPFAGSPDTIPVHANPGPFMQQPPSDIGEPQPLGNNPFAGSPDTIPVHANPGPFVQQPPSNTGQPQHLINNPIAGSSPSPFIQQSQVPVNGAGLVLTPSEGIEGKTATAPQPVIKPPSSTVAGLSEPLQSIPASSEKPDHAARGEGDDSRRIPVAQNLLRSAQAGSVIPLQPLQGMSVLAASVSSVIDPSAPLQPMPAALDTPGQTMRGEGDSAAGMSFAKKPLSPGQAGSVVPSQPVQGLTAPATSIATDPMQAAGSLARLLAQPTVSDQSPVFTPKVAAGTTPSPELVQHTVMDAVRTNPATPVTENLIQPAKPELAALQQFTATMSTATVAVDQGSQASAAAAVSGGLGGTVSQTGGLLLQSSSPVNLNLEAPLGTRDWGEAVGERIMWMVGRSIQGATIRVTPAHLGAIDIQLTMNQDQTNVSFSTQNGAVREALEAAIPRLREMFGESNLQLANVDVNQRQAEDQRGMFGNEGRDKGNGSEMGEDTQRGTTDTGNESQSPNHLAEPNTDRLLDHYA